MRRIYIAYTGGTIGMVKNQSGSLETKEGVFEDFVNTNDEIQNLCKDQGIKLKVEEYEDLIDSSDVKPSNWEQIIDDVVSKYAYYDGFVVVHGTDTMAYTSSIVSYALENLDKPVVITGAQRPIFDKDSDGLSNLTNSIRVAAGEGDIKEVCIVFDTSIIKGARATKISAVQNHAFTSPTSKLLGFIGPNGITTYKNRFLKKKGAIRVEKLRLKETSDVIVIKLFPAFDLEILRFLGTKKPKVKAIVIEAYGQGNSPSTPEFGDVIKFLTKEDIVVVVTSQPLHGFVQIGNYETSSIFRDNGAISAYDMTTEAAVTKLYYLFNMNLTTDQVKKEFREAYRGELKTSPDLPELFIGHKETFNIKKLISTTAEIDLYKSVNKSDWIKHLLSKIDNSVQEGNYIESIFICHILINDRLNSVLQKNDTQYNLDLAIPDKIQLILSLKKSSIQSAFQLKTWNEESQQFLGMGILSDVWVWYLNGFHPIEQLYADPEKMRGTDFDMSTSNLIQIAKSGKEAWRNLSAAVMRWKSSKNKGRDNYEVYT